MKYGINGLNKVHISGMQHFFILAIKPILCGGFVAFDENRNAILKGLLCFTKQMLSDLEQISRSKKSIYKILFQSLSCRVTLHIFFF